IMFTSYISYMVLFIPNLTCSCGGVIKEMSWRQHLGFNLFFIIISIVGILLQQRTKDFIAINRQSRKPV
ncbi:MauE/DoxX family redox-associated membrane protein, partial [Acinetobacter baumannii]